MGLETALIIGAIGIGIGAAAGGVAAVTGAFSGGGEAAAPEIPSLPATPQPEDSLAKAKADAAEKKRTAIMAGAETLKTGPQGSLLSSTQTGKKTLLGG